VEILVADTGSGIPEGYEEQVFEPFVSLKEGGTGLGLAFSRRVAHEHGGELSYRPTPGGGATFVLRLPVVPPGRAERHE
jgi:signal transduction histidine kinase